MKKFSLAILISTAVVGTSFAIPGIDLKVGAGYINLSPSGWVKYKGNQVDVKNDLHWGDSGNINAYLELGLPILPNIKVEYLPAKYDGTGKITKTFKFGDYTFTASDNIYSKLKLDQYYLSLFYNLPIPFVKPRIGVAVDYADGYAYVKSLTTGQEDRADFKAPIPMAYLGLHASVPKLPIEFDFEGKGIAYKGNRLIDIKAMGMFTLIGIPLIGKAYVGGGYRYQKIKLDDIDNVYSDLKFKGFFGEVGVEF
ncbi:TIGR04219 family outer membrane beta-barrel protein [Hydrogenothermus marinus]|uniref:Outer membrane protein n=1 Tax=Hydrogenothermus marinus TaxID=133270 RepID=A0A3M0BKX1_9AQUI|nr:TIGR04219 family outer membrane beta-barrel protein [Hydrogenothermus marinus]RMA97216.1 outer membrane protein [Hydrogenothermus marinus]